MPDFTFNTYKILLSALIKNGYKFQTFSDFLQFPYSKVIILRHDVDRTPKNALKMAEIENDMGIVSTYFFRSHSHVFIKKIIYKIESLGHEIGYHYENLSDFNGDYNKAILSFKKNLDKFREIATVKTICMHGRPLSKYNNLDLWRKFNFEDFDIIGEPYFSLDFNKIAYITDASRKWNNEMVNFRDKVNSNIHFDIKTTKDIINLIDSKEAPSSIMINIHPHNWALSIIGWLKIYLWQGFKNGIKRTIRQGCY